MHSTIIFFVGVACGLLIGWLLTRKNRARVNWTGQPDDRIKLEQLAPTVTKTLSFAKHSAEIQFLYDKRMTMFNLRRDHEWKIYFGALALLGAVDASIVTGHIPQSDATRWTWAFFCVVVFVAVGGYEKDLQIRNTADRNAMRLLSNTLCNLALVDHEDVLDEPPKKNWWNKYGWAFPWQMILFGAATLISAILPWILAGDWTKTIEMFVRK